MNEDHVRTSLGAEELVELGARRKKRRVPAATGRRVARKMEKALAPYAAWQMIVGSLRRGTPDVGDVEIVILPFDLDDLLEFLDNCGFSGGERKRVGVINGVKAEIYIAHGSEELGAMILWFTGDWQFNVAMNALARRQGYKKNQYGIWNLDGTVALQTDNERDFFDFLGIEYHSPAERSFSDRDAERKERAESKERGGGGRRRMGALDDDDGLFDRIGEAVDYEGGSFEGELQ